MNKFMKMSWMLLLLTVPFIFISGCDSDDRIKAPKNIIVMIADGCGYYQVDAANIYRFGKTGTAIYENFPVVYGMSTYSVDGRGYDPKLVWQSFEYLKKRATDSAAAATTMATGVKTYNGAIGVDSNKVKLETISERAEKLGKASGVITSVTFNHATPAGFAVHNESRRNYVDIAKEMVYESDLDVIMGCAHPEIDEDGVPVDSPNYEPWGGKDNWDKLVSGKIGDDADGDNNPDPWTFIDNRKDFKDLMDGETPKRVFGLARNASTLQQNRSGDNKALPYEVPLIETVPTLAEMSMGAINVLDNDPDGFFLMIEGGAVDWAGHGNQSGRVIEEKIAFDEAIEAVIKWIESHGGWEETMLVITGDHETGYLTGPNSGDDEKLAAGGTGAVWTALTNNGKGNLPGMEWHSGSHTNQLIPFYANGAGSELFHSCATGTDDVRGKYIDNGDVGRIMKDLWLYSDKVTK